MNSEERQLCEDLFQRALELPAEQRGVFLAERCPDDTVRARVEQLLAADADLGGTHSVAALSSADVRERERGGRPRESRAPGTTVASHFEIVELAGRGAMGEVYLAVDRRLERRVALKFLSPALASDPKQRARFLAEARAASALNHPNVCILHEVGELDDATPFLAFEYLEGEGLDRRIARGRVPIADVLDWATQLADALDAAHSVGLIHRDIKPSNLHVTQRGQLKVLDFGLAKKTAGEPIVGDVTIPGTIVGTPLYMSPEQVLGQPLDARSDLFSVGVVLYELLCGVRPFTGDSLAQVSIQLVHTTPEPVARRNPEIPLSLERVVNICLAKRPEERYPSARDLLVDLRRVVAGGGTSSSSGESFSGSRSDRSPSTATANATIDSAMPTVPLTLEAAATTYDSEIFLSYAPVDDHALPHERRGWIAGFHRNLEVRIEQLCGERVRICRVPGAQSPTVAEHTAESENVPTVISVVSPPYVKSPEHWEPVVDVCDAGKGHGGPQLFKVVKRPVLREDLPPALRRIFDGLSDHEFFDLDPSTGRVREYTESGAPTIAERYQERIYDLAEEISAVLPRSDSSESVRALSVDRKTVYLASTTTDLYQERDRLRRELLARGHFVLPEKPLPLIGAELVSAVRLALERADVSLHPVGGYYGVVPEGLDESIPELENRLAAECTRESKLERLIWIPSAGGVESSRQGSWVDHLRRDPRSQDGAEIIEGSLEIVRGELIDLLAGKKRLLDSSGKPPGAPPQLFLVCVPEDESAVEPVEDFFFDRGVEVVLPPFASAESERNKIHLRHLAECDAVLVYFGAAERHWVEFMLRDVAKAAGYRSQGAIEQCAVFVAPPLDHRKQRFRSLSADVIRGDGTVGVEILSEFAQRLRKDGQ